MDKILVTGGTGFFGLNFLKNLENNIFLLGNKRKLRKSHRQIIYLPKLDKKNLIKIVIKNNIKVIIHAAAITDIDFAEKNKFITNNTNFRFTKTISDIAKLYNLKIVFISTDQLYNNHLGYSKEIQKIDILNYYSLTKYKSENYIKENNIKYWIIRCSFFGWGTKYKKSLSDFIYYNLKNKNDLRLWSNIYFNPIYVSELIEIIKTIINYKTGTYNIGSKIHPNKEPIYAYVDTVLSLLGSFKFDDKDVEYSSGEEKVISLKGLDTNKMKRGRYLYYVSKDEFIPSEKNNKYKYFTQNSITVLEKEKIGNVFKKLEELNLIN